MMGEIAKGYIDTYIGTFMLFETMLMLHRF